MRFVTEKDLAAVVIDQLELELSARHSIVTKPFTDRSVIDAFRETLAGAA